MNAAHQNASACCNKPAQLNKTTGVDNVVTETGIKWRAANHIADIIIFATKNANHSIFTSTLQITEFDLYCCTETALTLIPG